MTVPERKSLGTPDERRALQSGVLEVTHVGSTTIGRGSLQPGWRWSTHMGVMVGTTSCPVHHVVLVLSGRFAFQMDDGDVIELVQDDLADIPAGHDAWVVGDESAVFLELSGNIGAVGLPMEHDRFLTTLLMTDIVDSTKTAERMGDAAWKQLLAQHDRVTRVQIDRFRGADVTTTGDGFLATFASAVAAVHAAEAIRTSLDGIGLHVRIGVHTGEVERTLAGIGGLSVHAAARVMALAVADEILVSGGVVALAEPSGLVFEDRGRHEVKGISRPIEVARLAARA